MHVYLLVGSIYFLLNFKAKSISTLAITGVSSSAFNLMQRFCIDFHSNRRSIKIWQTFFDIQ